MILNEAHDTPRYRAFALTVARSLKRLGYTHLAAETFSNDPMIMRELSRDRYVKLGTGTYTIDPVFADFVRQSLQLGYRPVAYEENEPGVPGSREERIAAREEAQAHSLATQIAAAGPAAKFFIFVGYSHAAEAPLRTDGTASEWMAARLKAKTGIDPLTIDQTVLDEFTHTRSDRSIYAAIAPRLGTRPAVLMNGRKPFVLGRLKGAVDLQVVHPPMRLVRGRPSWLQEMGRQPVAIPADLLPAAGHRLVQAFIAEEDSTIPVDQVVVSAGSAAPVMMLPTRPIRFAKQDPVAAEE